MWEAIRANRRRSIVLMTGLLLVYGLLGFSVGLLFDLLGGSYTIVGYDEYGNPIFGTGGIGMGSLLGFGIAAALWALLVLIAWAAGRGFILFSVGARKLEKAHHPKLWNVVEEMAIASQQPVPEVYVIEDPAPNAFATGTDPKKSAIAVTRGLLERLTRDELQGVIAHEMAHIKNRDVRMMTLAGVTVGTIVIFGDLILRILFYSGGGIRIGRGRGALAVLVIMLVLGLLALFARLWAYLFYFGLSRQREYLADASAAIFTRYPAGLASALEKISGTPVKMAKSNSIVRAMYIVAPAFVGLFSTHPPIGKRVAILRSMGTGVSYQNYMQAYQGALGTRRALFGQETLGSAPAVVARAASAEEAPRQLQREAKDAVLAASGYRFLACACGVRLKAPAGRALSLRCPRCGQPIAG